MKALQGRLRFGIFQLVLGGLIFLHSIGAGQAQNRHNGQGVMAFLSAIAMNETDTAAQLLEANTNLAFAVDNLSKLPLLEAAAAGNAALVKRLLELGADINIQGDTMSSAGSQDTALHWAIKRNHPDTCRVLLEAGANPNRMNANYSSPLHLAFNEQHDEMAVLLLDYGADPFLEKRFTNDKTTPFELAITRSTGVLVPRMLGQDRQHPLGTKSRVKPVPARRQRQPLKTAVDILAERGKSLLAAAAQRGELEAVQALLKAGVSANGATDEGTPLLQAFSRAAANGGTIVTEPWREIRDLLIKNGADYDAFAATALGDLKQARQLLAADKNVIQSRDRDGQTPLYWAVQNNQLPLTSFWLEAGMVPATTNFAGQTALHLAATLGLAEQVKVLLAAQAPTQLTDTNGWTPLDAAIHAQKTETIRLLLNDKTVAPRPERAVALPLHTAAASGNLAALATLAEATNNLAARNELGLTPLQVAVQNGHLAAAALLVDQGAEVNVRDPDGNTLLHRILLQRSYATVYDQPPTNWLERLGQDPRKKIYLKYLTVGQYEQGPNPLLQTVSFLLACGVDATATNRAGRTINQLATDEAVTKRLVLFDGDHAALLKLLGTGGGNINATDADGNTAMHRVGQNTDADKLTALIAGGADVNATNQLGRTPLHAFAERIWGWDMNEAGTNQPFQLLVKSGANVNAQDNEGLTPLHVLAAANTSFKREATQALLAAGANPNLRDRQGRTPAHLFLSGKWPWSEAGQCITLLVNAGGDLAIKDDHGKTTLHYYAALGGQNPAFFIRNLSGTFLAARVNLEARDDEGNTPLVIATKTGTRDVFDWLLKQGADLDATNNVGETPRILSARSTDPFARSGARSAETDLFQAVREGNTNAAARLLKADPQLANLTDRSKQTPLRLAVTLRQTNMISFLESHGARWDAGSAALAGRTDALEAILQKTPAAVTNTVFGKGLIHIAAANGDVATVKLLIAVGCDLQAQDNWGLSPLGRALIKTNREMQELLIQHGAKENFFDAVYANNLPSVATWLKQDKSLSSSRNHNRNCALEIAAAAGYPDIVKLLLKTAAPRNSDTSTNIQSAVHLAAFYNQTNALALLLRAGAKVNQTDQAGFTPLHKTTIQDAAEAANLLLKNKADVNARITQPGPGPGFFTRPGQTIVQDTPLHLAALYGTTNLVKLLLKSGAEVNAGNAMMERPLDLATRQSITSPVLFMLSREMLDVLEPLHLNQQSPANLLLTIRDRLGVVVALIKAAGGTNSQNQATDRGGPFYPR